MDVEKPDTDSDKEEKYYSRYGKVPWWLILLWVGFFAWVIIYIIRGFEANAESSFLTQNSEPRTLNSPWPLFRHDPQHTGYSPYNGPKEGNLKWYFQTEDTVDSSPAIGLDGTIYVGSVDGKLYAINQDGTLKWAMPTGSKIYASPAIGIDGTIYVCAWDGKLFAVSPHPTLPPEGGGIGWEIKWTCQINGRISSSPVIGADGTIYFGSDNYTLYAVGADGRIKWGFYTRWYIDSSPAIGIDGTIYVGSNDRNLYAINPDGPPQAEKWTFQTGSQIT